MNLKQAEIVLEKITRLYKSMKLDERNIDVFEQDLMLSYIRQLYDSFSPEKPISKRVHPVLPPKETPPAPKPVAKEAPAVKATSAPKTEAPKAQEPAPPPKPVEVPKPIEAPKVVEPPKVVQAPKAPEPPRPATTRMPPPPRPQASAKLTGLSAADRADLFEFKEATELSEKLSMQPIRDLTKAMGLNEKIFTINELFGGDSTAFDTTVRKLNTFATFEKAAEYLASGVAHTYDWPNRKKKKKALNFIQLVKRRYK